MQSSLRLLALAAAVASLAACSSLGQPPKVDFPDTAAAVPARPNPAARALAKAPPTGSLFRTDRYRPAFEDPKARLVGDTVTIQILENLTASQKSSSTVDRSSEVSGAIAAFPLLPASLTERARLGATTGNTFSGKGGTESANTFVGTITATVIEVLPNGHLVLAGEKQIGVNQNVDVLRFSGTVDPRHLQPGSVVSSTQVANARIASSGRGAQAEAQTTGWFSRFFLSLSPF